jgi:Na+-transporting NADH:ubiquinone oxidoreductase subunit NqrD
MTPVELLFNGVVSSITDHIVLLVVGVVLALIGIELLIFGFEKMVDLLERRALKQHGWSELDIANFDHEESEKAIMKRRRARM